VEIKGVCRIPAIPQLVHNEALRQARLLGIRDHLRDLGLTPDNLDGGSHDVTRALADTAAPLLRKAIVNGKEIRLQVIPGTRRILRAFTQPGLYFAQELSGRVRVIACLDDPVNLFVRDEDHGIGLARQHSRELNEPALTGPTAEEWQRLARQVGASDDDGLVLVWGPREDTRTAVQEIRDRMAEAIEGIPNETRMPFPTGTTDFERILPGPDRMYPDTDLPPMPLEDSQLRAIAARLPALPWVREERLVSGGLRKSFARALALSPRFNLLEELLSACRTDKQARLLSWVFHDLLKALRRKGLPVERVIDADLRALLGLALEGRLYREGLAPLLERLATRQITNEESALTEILEELFPEVARGETPLEIRQEGLTSLFGDLGSQSFAAEAQRRRALMRPAMARYRGIAPGEAVSEAVADWCLKHPVADERSGE
jgi:glutamyl-tRNA(Gln) amidotransferase subunit E